MSRTYDIGIMFKCQYPPEVLLDFVRNSERAGFDEVWIVEDCFFAGGIASTATALAHTEHIRVGLGILPAVARNAAFTAMELAALARLHPGRFLPGLGHGVGEWMKQVGAFPASQLAALEEVTATVQALLAGERVTFHGRHVHLDEVQLDFPPATPPPLSLGVRGPKSLRLSGRVANGTILAEYASPAYVRWALEQIQAGQREAGREAAPHRVTVYALWSMAASRDAAYNQLRPRIAAALASGELGPYLEPLGIAAEVRQLADAGGAARLERDMPNEWLAELAVVGTPDDCRMAIARLADAGADSVVLIPPDNGWLAVQVLAAILLPR